MILKSLIKKGLVVLTLWSTNVTAQNPTIEELTGLEYGNYVVGFQFLKRYDISRNAIAEQVDKSGRIVPIYLWYPSDHMSQNGSMSIKKYINFLGMETNFSLTGDSVQRNGKRNFGRSFLWLKDLSIYYELQKIDMQTRAGNDLAIANGKFPLILLAHGSIINWLFVAEFLASHGYVVAFSPVTGTYDKRLEENISGVVTQLEDMEFAMSQVHSWPQVDSDKIGILGFSLGSLAALNLAAKNNHIKSVVSMDGVIGGKNEGSLLYELPYFENHNFISPLLHFTSGADFTNDRSIINQLQFADRYIVEVSGMRHRDFIGDGFYNDLKVPLNGNLAGSHKSGFQDVMDLTLLFLNSTLNSEPQLFRDELNLESKTKSYVISKMDGYQRNYEFAQLIELVFNEDFNQLFEILKAHSHVEIAPFSYSTFHDIGMQMLFKDYNPQAKRWFESFAESYPNAFKPHYLLGVTYQRLKNLNDAQKTFELAKAKLQNDEYLNVSQKSVYKIRIDQKLND